jgi:hypothetical protein
MTLLARLRPYRRALLGCVAALLACGALAPLSRGADGGLAAARSRWTARPFSRYQIVVQEDTNSSSCRQAIEVREERIERVLQNRCGRLPSWTVSNLFTWVEQTDAATTRCYPSTVTCVCYAVYSLRADYDPLLGYPHSMTYAWHLRLNWTYLGHWKRLWRTGELPACANTSRFAEGHITLTVVELVPFR